MATKKSETSVDSELEKKLDSSLFNPLLVALRENDKKNLFKTNVTTAFHKTGFPLIDYYFGSVINSHDELGNIIKQERRIGQAAGTFNLIVGGSGTGKAQPMSTVIPSINGPKLMRDLTLGDHVFDENGNPTEVVGIYPQGEMEIYKLTFSDGRYSLCTKDHLWEVKNNKGEISVLTLGEIQEGMLSGNSYSIPNITSPINYRHQQYQDDPYKVGLNIGNEIDKLRRRDSIPSIYMYNSVDIRKELLNGIVDSKLVTRLGLDDFEFMIYRKYNNCRYKIISEDIIDLISGLGFRIKVLDDVIFFNLDKSEDYISIQKIEYSYKEECQCIKVDTVRELYITEQNIVTHNTTLAAQIAANIVYPYNYSNIIHFDCENRFDVSRCENITKLPSSFFNSPIGERYMIKTGLVGLDIIQQMIVRLYSEKMINKATLTVDSGYKDEFGKKVMILQPSVIIIDSITTVLNETFNPDNTKDISEAEKMRSNTEGARDAKTLKGFFKDIIPLCKEANIIIYGINHINDNMGMNSFLPVARQQNFLKQSEAIPGGKTMIYYPYNIIKLTAKPNDDFTKEDDGFAGHKVMVEPIKSSSNQSGNNSKGVSFDMIFSFQDGFDSLRSMINYGRDNKIIEGNRNRLRFKDDEGFTFNIKDINKDNYERLKEDIKKYIIPTLDKHLPFIEPASLNFDNRFLDY